MLRTIIVNTITNGQLAEQVLDGRKCLVTSCVSIELDSVMNELLYPANVVRESYPQLDRLPAPARHPVINGQLVPANDPVAVNAHSTGAYVFNPRLSGTQVINDFAVDIEVAERTEDGRTLLNRLREGTPVPVSTGMRADVMMVDGEKNGRPYRGVVSNIKYDHVAWLPDERPAGENTYTLNSESEQAIVCNVQTSYNELHDKMHAAAREFYNGDDMHPYVADIMSGPDEVVLEVNGKTMRHSYSMDNAGNVTINGAGVEVTRRVSFEPVTTTSSDGVAVVNEERDTMDKKTLILALIANRLTTFTSADRERLEAMDELTLADTLANSVEREPVTLEAAIDVVNASDAHSVVDAATAEQIANNADALAEYQTAKAEERKALVEHIVANSAMTAEDLEPHTDDGLRKLAETVAPRQNYGLNNSSGPATERTGGTVAQCADFAA